MVTHSTTEAEYRSLVHTFAELSWISKLLTHIHISCTTPTLLFDNQSAISIAYNPVFHNRTKHMEIDVFFMREKLVAKQLCISDIPALDQWTDILTMALPSTRFALLRAKTPCEEFFF